MAKNDRKRPKMTKNGLNVCNMTEIDWFDVVTAFKGHFWVSVLTSSSSEAGPAKNLKFGTVKFFSLKDATYHILSYSFTQSAKFLKTRVTSEDTFFSSSKNELLSWPIFGHLGLIFEVFGHFWPNYWKYTQLDYFNAKNLNEIGKVDQKPKTTNLTPTVPQNVPRAKNSP